jgi:hypothetical protein
MNGLISLTPHHRSRRLIFLGGLIGVAILLMLLMNVPSTLAQATVVRIDPATLGVPISSPGSTVNVVIDDVANLGAFQFDLVYDPAIVQITGVALGPFPGSTGRTVIPVGPVIDNTAGRTTFGAFSFGLTAGPDGSGVLAVVTLIPKSADESPLNLENTQVTDSSGAIIPASLQNGTIVVNPGGPTSITLRALEGRSRSGSWDSFVHQTWAWLTNQLRHLGR